jgi:hypothetical protein
MRHFGHSLQVMLRSVNQTGNQTGLLRSVATMLHIMVVLDNHVSRADRTYDAVGGYGLLSPGYQHIAARKLVELLRTIQN